MLSVMTVVVDAVAHQLPRGQPRALEKRARLVGEHADPLALLRRRRGSRRARCRTRRRERSGVAVREHPRAVGDDSAPNAPIARQLATSSS